MNEFKLYIFVSKDITERTFSSRASFTTSETLARIRAVDNLILMRIFHCEHFVLVISIMCNNKIETQDPRLNARLKCLKTHSFS